HRGRPRGGHGQHRRHLWLQPGPRREYAWRNVRAGIARRPASLLRTTAQGTRVMILVIDNYDSFTFNLVQYLGELGADVTVKRNDRIDVAGVKALRPSHILISPGPCTPA